MEVLADVEIDRKRSFFWDAKSVGAVTGEQREVLAATDDVVASGPCKTATSASLTDGFEARRGLN
jgi:hypothetical protein